MIIVADNNWSTNFWKNALYLLKKLYRFWNVYSFEYNGLWCHDERYRPKNYHLNKTDGCDEKGIQLIHIWGDDWQYKQDIIKSMILNKLGKVNYKIFARKTEIKEVDSKTSKLFLEQNKILIKNAITKKV